ncbi:MAG: carbohydrate porin [Xanthomonadales bacterium]|nr:carbohydrate porin [Xanthomonadales bacterium]
MLTNRFTLAKNAAVALLLAMSAQLFTVPSAQAQGSGILPVPDYPGVFANRSYLLGDLDGKRSEWAQKGVTFDIDYNQYFQAVTDGGLDRDSEYGGTINYNINLDFDRMGLIPGGLLQIRARSRYGNSVNSISGSIVPVNTDATLLTASRPDENIGLWLPVINYTQFLSEKFALGFGKYDTLDSTNEFAGGRGRNQWWNQNFNMPLSPLLIVPNVTTGAMAMVMSGPNLTMTGMVGTSTDTSNRSGFNDFDDGLFAIGMLSYQYQLSGQPGGLVFMPGYGWGQDFTELNGSIYFDEGQLVPTTKDDTWVVSTSFWQYLWTEEAATQPIDLSDGRQDLQGIGVFLRIQAADTDTNPMDYSIAGGINAKGLIPGRDNDAMGIAYVYNKLSDGRLLNFIGIDAQSSVWELFYNIELIPSVHMTLNAQKVNSAFPDIDTATILGTSLQMRF